MPSWPRKGNRQGGGQDYRSGTGFFLAVWPKVSYPTSLSLRFLTCQMGIIIFLSQAGGLHMLGQGAALREPRLRSHLPALLWTWSGVSALGLGSSDGRLEGRLN